MKQAKIIRIIPVFHSCAGTVFSEQNWQANRIASQSEIQIITLMLESTNDLSGEFS
jgi:hypothetical protein